MSAGSGFGAGELNSYRLSKDNVRVSHFGFVDAVWNSDGVEEELAINLRLIDVGGAVQANHNLRINMNP